MKPVRTLARAMLGGIFVVQGAQAVRNPEPLVPRAKPVTDRVAPMLERINPALPTDAGTLIRVNGAAQVAGGLLMLTRWHRPAAALLAGSMVPTTLAGHAFWAQQDPQQRAMHRVQFLKNLGLLGGLLLAASDTEGEPGLRWRTSRALRDANRAASRTLRDANRSAHRAVTETNKSVQRGVADARDSLHRTVKQTKGRTRLAVRAAEVGRRLPG